VYERTDMDHIDEVGEARGGPGHLEVIKAIEGIKPSDFEKLLIRCEVGLERIACSDWLSDEERNTLGELATVLTNYNKNTLRSDPGTLGREYMHSLIGGIFGVDVSFSPSSDGMRDCTFDIINEMVGVLINAVDPKIATTIDDIAPTYMRIALIRDEVMERSWPV